MTQINFEAEAQSVFFLFYTPRLSNKFIKRKLFGGVGEKKGFGELLIPWAHNFFKGYKKTHSDNQSDCYKNEESQ